MPNGITGEPEFADPARVQTKLPPESSRSEERERERESAKNGINLEINAYLLSYKFFFSYILEIIILYTAVKN